MTEVPHLTVSFDVHPSFCSFVCDLSRCSNLEMSSSSETSESGAPTQGPSTSARTSPSLSSAGKIVDGANYRVIHGKKENSNIIVSGDKSYLIEKSMLDKNTDDPLSATPIFYLKCQVRECLGRALIRKGVLRNKTDGKPHMCDRSHLAKIAVQEALNRMKERAQEEGTSSFVSRYTTEVFLL